LGLDKLIKILKIMLSEKQIRNCALEFNDIMGLNPPLNPKLDLGTLTEELRKIINGVDSDGVPFVREGDVFEPETEDVIREFRELTEHEQAIVAEDTPPPTGDDLFSQINDAKKLHDLKDIAIANVEFKAIRGKLEKYKSLEELHDAMFEILTSLSIKAKKEKAVMESVEEVVTKNDSVTVTEEIPEKEKVKTVTTDKAVIEQEIPPRKVLKINPKFKEACPVLNETEFADLTKLILKDGVVLQPILAWDGTIVDGHNRYEIATKHNIPYRVESIVFDSEKDAIIWIKENAISQRNLSDYARFELVKGLEELIKADIKQNRQYGKTAPGKKMKEEDKKPLRDSRKEFAEKAKMSPTKIAKAKIIEKKASPEVKEKLRKGEVTMGKVYEEVTKKKGKVKENTDKFEAGAKSLEKWIKFYKEVDGFAEFVVLIEDVVAQIRKKI